MNDKTETDALPVNPENRQKDEAHSKYLAPETPRETARKAAKARWANWASKKTV